MTRAPPDLAEIERAMVRIRRHMSRRSLHGLISRAVGEDLMAAMGVVDAIDGGASTVGEVGRALGLDPSRASRLVSSALKAGVVRREASQDDGRQVLLVIAPMGLELLERARRARLTFYERVLRDWSAADRKRFGQLLTRFVDGLGGRPISDRDPRAARPTSRAAPSVKRRP